MSTSNRSPLFAYLALGIAIVSIGFSAIFVRWANAPGSVTSFYRMAIPMVLLAWPFYQRGKVRKSLPRRGVQLALLGAFLTLLILNMMLQLPITGYSLNTYLNFIGLGLVVQIAGLLSINYAQGYLPASIVAPTMLGQPVMTAILAGPLLGERLSLWQAVGGVAVLLGVYTVHRSRAKESVE